MLLCFGTIPPDGLHPGGAFLLSTSPSIFLPSTYFKSFGRLVFWRAISTVMYLGRVIPAVFSHLEPGLLVERSSRLGHFGLFIFLILYCCGLSLPQVASVRK